MKVALVGADPGAPDLITVRGLRRLAVADVVIHDRLVAPELIAEAPAGARRINVGKAPKRRRFPQAEIDRFGTPPPGRHAVAADPQRWRSGGHRHRDPRGGRALRRGGQLPLVRRDGRWPELLPLR